MFSCLCTATTLLAGLVAITKAIANDGSLLLDALIALEMEHSDLTAEPPSLDSARAEIATINAALQPSLAGAAGGPAVVADLNRLIFDDLGLKATHDVDNPEHLFLSSVLEAKRGYCLGLAALHLVLADLNGLPLHAVATPSHVFLRYDDGTTRINIETFQRGANLPDERYIEEHRIPAESIRDGVFMRNLTTDEFLAQMHNNIGVIYSKRGQFEQAEAEYRRALALHPNFPAAHYNLGNDLLQRGDYRQAVKSFNRALRLYRTDVWALNNRGLAYKKQGKPKKARRDFEEALLIEPGFDAARRNLSALEAQENH